MANINGDICPICYEDMGQIDLEFLPCCHKFHSKCIQEWKKRNPSCPLCKISIYTRDIDDNGRPAPSQLAEFANIAESSIFHNFDSQINDDAIQVRLRSLGLINCNGNYNDNVDASHSIRPLQLLLSENDDNNDDENQDIYAIINNGMENQLLNIISLPNEDIDEYPSNEEISSMQFNSDHVINEEARVNIDLHDHLLHTLRNMLINDSYEEEHNEEQNDK